MQVQRDYFCYIKSVLYKIVVLCLKKTIYFEDDVLPFIGDFRILKKGIKIPDYSGYFHA